ncbi:hypothetical protein FJZ31_33905 [Candidatus Poribacteria bacterium]|nr:hypothetical protein [Candidatus Poribacteria bacterium]
MKALERKTLKQHIINLAQVEFGNLLKKVRFSGPFEEEDLDVDLILRKKIPFNELDARLLNIYHPLEKKGYNVLIGCRFDELPKKTKTKQKSGSKSPSQ